MKGLSETFAEPEGAPLSWRTDMRYSGLNIGMMGIFYEPLQRCMSPPLLALQMLFAIWNRVRALSACMHARCIALTHKRGV